MSDAVILVVDDDPESLALAVGILQSGGFSVRAADNGTLAIEAALAAPPDLVVLDVQMEPTDGFTVCRHLKGQPATRDLPILLMSAFTEAEEWTKALEHGAVDFLAKPYGADELLTRVRTHLNLSRTQRTLREAVAALAEKELQYQTLADAGAALIWAAGPDSGRTYFNRRWLEFTGRTLEQESGRGWLEGIHPEDRDRIWTFYQEAFRRREPFESEYRLRAADGTYRWIMSKGTPNRNLQGEFIGYVGDCFDITDLRKAREILDRNEKLEALGSLAGGIAHDFNNLFAGLFAYLEMARGDCADHPTALRHLDKALGTFGKAQDLTRRLLTFAKGGVPVRRPTDLGPLVLEAVRSGSPGWAVVPEVRVADGIPPCEVDPSQVTELVGHLVGNAVQALSQGGAVTIAVDLTVLGEGERPDLRAGSYARITVVDSGPGIPPGDLPRVFNPFFSTKKKGGGLGLPTCYSIARRHDGAIDIESEVGRGTRVQVYFPALAAAPVPDAGRPEARAGTGPVLVMDDDELIRGLMVEWLDAGGWPTVAAQDGAEALGRLDELLTQGTPPAFALLDLTVPGGQGGREILPAIRSRLPGLPIFAVSGYHDDPVMARPRDFGFTDRLPKPFLQADLLDMLARNLKEHP